MNLGMIDPPTDLRDTAGETYLNASIPVMTVHFHG
jgi:hypothetical protein